MAATSNPIYMFNRVHLMMGKWIGQDIDNMDMLATLTGGLNQLVSITQHSKDQLIKYRAPLIGGPQVW